MEQDERRSTAGSLVGDAKPIHLDRVHGHVLADRNPTGTFAHGTRAVDGRGRRQIEGSGSIPGVRGYYAE